MPGIQNIRDAYFERAIALAEETQRDAAKWASIARDYGAALNYICCLIEYDGGKYTLKDGFDMQYLTSLIQGETP